MIDVKSAVKFSLEHALELLGEDQVMNLALEEVEFNEDTKERAITVGFERPWESSNPMLKVDRKRFDRSVRVAANGTFKGIDIRDA